MEEWKSYKLSDLCSIIGGGTPRTSEASYWNGDIPWLSVKDFGNENKYVFKTEKHITEDGLNNSSTKLLQRGDIIISARGTVGAMAMIPFPMAFNQSCFGLRAKNNVNPDFLYYLTKTKIAELQLNSHGSVFDTITRDTFDKIDCLVPDYNTQERIAVILSNLDEKIELNNRINHNLEQQAQALFKSWFVDFEPFKDGDFKETELGRIPIGWNVIPFKSFITVSKEKVMVGELPEYSVTNNGIIPRDLKFNKKLSQSTTKNKVLRHNDLVFGMSRDILNWGIMEDEIGSVSSAYNVYAINKDLIMPKYLRLYMIAKLPYFNDLKGTAAREGQGLDKGALNQKKVYIPSSDICLKFFNIYDHLIEMQKEVSIEAQQLANYRDYILPHLLSGTLIFNSINV